MVIVSDKLRSPGARTPVIALARFARLAQRAAGLRGEVSVLLASKAEVRKLNRKFRGQDKPTDVLSFPARGNGCAGDIAICVPIAAAQAQRHGHELTEEIKILILHGLLHLAGYDHEDGDGAMARKENQLRRKLRLHSNLIARNSYPGGRAPALRKAGKQRP